MPHIPGFRSVHTLCTVDKATQRLRATHFAICEVGGPAPVWHVYTVNWRFVRMFGSKSQIERAYPKLRWRRYMAEWRLQNVDNLSIEKRREYLEQFVK